MKTTDYEDLDGISLPRRAEDALREKSAYIEHRPEIQQQLSIYEYDRDILYIPFGSGKWTRVTLYTPLSQEERILRKELNGKI
jgi:hypothetical protein